MLSQSTLVLLGITRRPTAVLPASKMKRPTGGRPNPCALHIINERPSFKAQGNLNNQALRAKRKNASNAPAKIVAHVVERVLSGDIPAGVPLTGAELRAAFGRKDFHGGWEHVATALAAAGAPVRIRCKTNRGKHARYIIEIL